MSPETRAQEILTLLRNHYDEQFATALTYETDWQLLFSVLLSAQTTDENVNKVTRNLFRQLPTIQFIAEAPRELIEELVYSTGYYKAKAHNLQRCARTLQEQYGGNVPTTLNELITLPGVGRKTANVLIHVLGHPPEGIVMDTHIQRVTMRLGYIEKKDATLGEQVMMKVLPEKDWKDWGDLLIQHGREICKARKPLCNQCPVASLCPSAEVA